jgi:MSHA biogenesis protein MshI
MFERRRARSDVLLGVCPREDGIALAGVRRAGAKPPSLSLCAFEAAQGSEGQAAVLARAVRAHRLERFFCTTVMDIGSYTSLLVEAPDVPPEELRAAMRWRVKDLIDFHVDDAVIDVFEVSGRVESGRSRLMYAVVARAPLVQQRVDVFSGAGLKLTVIDIPEFAMRNIAAMLPEDVAGVGFIYLIGGGGLITLTHQGKLYLSRLVDMRRDAGAAARATDARHQETRQWLDGIVIEIQRSMDYYESHFGQAPLAHLVVAPLPHAVAGIGEYLGAQLGIEARLLDLNTLIDSPEPLGPDVQYRCLMAIGAALRTEAAAL